MKKFVYCGIVVVVLVVFLALRYTCEFVYVSPTVNTEVFPYIAKSIKQVDRALNKAVFDSFIDGKRVKINYKNAYGSGFLLNNPIPNDLDFSVGVNLGRYKYDGTNSKEIAENLYDKIQFFQQSLLDSINNDLDGYYSNTSVVASVIKSVNDRKDAVNAISSSFDSIFKDKDYVVYLSKKDSKNVEVDLPFVLKSNEILIEDFPPVTLFTKDVLYYPNQENFLRELTIVIDYSFEIENVKTAEVKDIELVGESFLGQRLQLSRRFFVPIAFIGENSANYLKTLSYLNSDEEYLNYRLFNFGRHLQEVRNLTEFDERPVKLLKRVLQCANLIKPVLSQKEFEEINSSILDSLSNPNLSCINDYYTILGNLIQITSSPSLFFKLKNKNEFKQLFIALENDLDILKNAGLLNSRDYQALKNANIELENACASAKKLSDVDYINLYLLKFMDSEFLPVQRSVFAKIISAGANIESYVAKFNKIYEDAGFHLVDFYWLDKNTIGILKDNFTSSIKQDDLKKMALENNLVDVNYVFIDKSSDKINKSIHYSLWVRYNPTKVEEQNWQLLRTKLLNDKKNFNIKRKFVIVK